MDVLAADGTVRWTTNVAGAAARSVAIADGVAVVPVQPGALVALDVASGKQMWRAKLAQEGGVGTPVIDRGRVMTATGLDEAAQANRAVVALDLRTGKPDWTWYSPTGERVYAPAVRGDRAYVVSEAGYVLALDVATGTEAWRAPTSGPIEANAATTEDGVIAADNGGSLLALAPGDGSVLWQAPIQGVPYAPVVACGLVLVPSDLGALTAFGAP
jgi:outer membrane protein assembly factor BamB